MIGLKVVLAFYPFPHKRVFHCTITSPTRSFEYIRLDILRHWRYTDTLKHSISVCVYICVILNDPKDT